MMARPASMRAAMKAQRGGSGFLADLAGYAEGMSRADVLRQVRGARGPRGCASALEISREWLREHPDDGEMAFAMLELLRVGTMRPRGRAVDAREGRTLRR